MRQTEVYEWLLYGLAENMFCVSDTRNKMKKCPRIIAEMYEVNTEWGGGERGRAHVLPFFLPICLCVHCFVSGFVLFCFFLYLVVDVYLILLLNQKIVWSPTWFFVGKLCCPRNAVNVFVAFNTGSFEKDTVFGRAWPLHW